jgi:glycosyltransferase involved in cell wall biosynthesis
MNKNDYRRILLVTSSNFNSYTGTGITLSNLFEGWPLDRVAIVHNDKFDTNNNICRLEYKLGDSEQRYIFPLSIIKRSKNNPKPKKELESVGPLNQAKSTNYLTQLKLKKALNAIIGDYELFINQVASKQLLDWIDDFNPDLLYFHFSSLGSLRFCKSISEHCQIPYAIHFMDDFYHFNYTKGILSLLFKSIWKKEMKAIVKNASLRMGISEKMSFEYSKTFNADFYSFFNIVDTNKWNNTKTPKTKSDNFEILYAGTINNKNISSLHNVAITVEEINNNGKKVNYSIYTFQPRADSYKPHFSKYKKTNIYEVPEGDGIIPLLKKSDLLLLSIDFTQESIERMRYSMFTKIPAYMMSGTPILFWGPNGIASTEYAKESGWAVVVDKNDPKQLEEAIEQLITNSELRDSIVYKAQMLANEKHSTDVVKKKFHSLLNTME